ncbi:MAG: hypothetical protein FJ405_00495 [Verrucomicrobia bacterium]|nr:hypothetical protein [Verrucomicrobiota bacterium]
MEKAESFSRKAIIGASQIPVFLLALLMMFPTWTNLNTPAEAGLSKPSWWQVVLVITVGAGGVTAPFLTTLFGWWAVGEIRRSRGRIGGLPLAVFDGLFFPLLALNVILVFGLSNTAKTLLHARTTAPMSPADWNVMVFGIVLLCLFLDFLIARRVWRTVRLSECDALPAGDWWWGTRRGGVAIALLCVLVIGLVANRRQLGTVFGFHSQRLPQPDFQAASLPADDEPDIDAASREASRTLNDQAPVVVETSPVSGERNVAPGVRQIRVRFSKPMADDSWSWSEAWMGSTPEFIGRPHFEPDGRTCIVQARLEPDTTYGFWLNSDTFKNFKDRSNRSAIPYLLLFQTTGQ